MEYTNLGALEVSRFILGSNPFIGVSHQSTEQDGEMLHYYTVQRIKETLREAESLGIKTLIARTDHHMMRVLLEYWDEGGGIDWIGQTCPLIGPTELCVQNAIQGGARACYIHGGVMDYLLANDALDQVQPAIDRIREAGLVAGIAGHNPKVFEWAEQALDADFYMCCYYNAAKRDTHAAYVSGKIEEYFDEDREVITNLIQGLSKPVIHYKILAAGRKDPDEAFAYAASKMRPCDAVCVGVFTKDSPDMLEQDVRLFERHPVVRSGAG